MNQEIFQLQNGVISVISGNKSYTDNVMNFLADSGKSNFLVDVQQVIYNKTFNLYVINDVKQIVCSDTLLDAILNDIDTLLERQAERQPKPEPTLEERKAAKLAEIDEMTKKEITGGFISKAKGAANIYDSAEGDQLTFSAMYAASKSPDFETTAPYNGSIPIRAVTPEKGEKEILQHNAAEMQKLIDDLALHIGRCKQIAWQLQEQVKAATSQSDLDRITWIS